MPKLPIYTAEGVSASPSSPSSIAAGPNPYAPLAEGMQDVAKGVHTIASVNDRLAAQRDDLAMTQMASTYRTGNKAIFNALATDPDIIEHPERYADEFAKRSRSLYDEIAAKAPSDVVARAFKSHFVAQFQADGIEAVNKGQKLQFAQNLGQLEGLKHRLSTEATDLGTVESPGPGQEEVTALIRTFHNAVDKAYQSGAINDKGRVDMKYDFQQLVLSKSMSNLGLHSSVGYMAMIHNDQDGQYNDLDTAKRMSIIDTATKKERERQTQNDKTAQKAHDVVFGDFMSRALRGDVSLQPEIDKIKDNQNPLFKNPEEGAHLEKIMNNPPFSGPVLAVNNIMQRYSLGPETQERITAAKKELDDLGRTLDRPSEAIIKASDHLNSRATAVRNTNAAEMAAGRKYLHDSLEASETSVMPGPLGQMRKNRMKIDEAKGNKAIDEGQDPKKVTKDILDKRKAAEAARSQQSKDAADLLKGRR